MIARLRLSRPVLSVLCWAAFAWIPWAFVVWRSRPFADDDVRAIALAAVGSVLVGAFLSAAVLRGKEIFGWARLNGAWVVGQLLGLVAAVLLIGNAVVVLFTYNIVESTVGWTTVLVCAALGTVAYTVVLALAAFWPTVSDAAASRLFASLAIHRASLGPIAISVAGSLILILSSETWVAVDDLSLTVVVAVWVLGASISLIVLVRGAGMAGARTTGRTAGRLCVASLIAFFAFFVAGANLAPPMVVYRWGVDFLPLAFRFDYGTSLVKLSILLTALVVTTIATSLRVAGPDRAAASVHMT